MNDPEVNRKTETIPTELSKEDLLKYVELDLWSKFQDRLWKLVGIVLTISTVLGLLGVPYYIRSEVTSHLVAREKEFTERIKEVTEYSKLLASLRGRYDGERYRLDSDVMRVIDILEKIDKGGSDKEDVGGFHDPTTELFSLISRSDFAAVVENSIARNPLEMVPDYLKGEKRIMPPTNLTIAVSGFSLIGGGKDPHPVKNGTYEGVLRDLKFRIVALEALRRSTEKLQEEMLALGANSRVDDNAKVITVDSLHADFQRELSAQISSIANALLSKEEKVEFEKCQVLYTLGYKVKYSASSEPTPAHR